MNQKSRRGFIKVGALAGTYALFSPFLFQSCKQDEKEEEELPKNESQLRKAWFEISLAAYSLHRAFEAGTVKNMDFPRIAKEKFGINAVELLNIYFMDKALDKVYLKDFKQMTDGLGVKNLLIMIDREGDLATPNSRSRKEAVLNHFKWVEAAASLGCHSIRVNAKGEGTRDQVKEAGIDGLSQLGKFAQNLNINVIVENHGGYSSDGGWLSSMLKAVDMPNVGALPDFGNFCIKGTPRGKGECEDGYDRYKGVGELMPFAKGLSAKSYTFDQDGEETTIDYKRMLKVAQDAGYKGYIGIEFEGDELSEEEGILATKRLLEKYQTRNLSE
ncbi:MAG: sugar phosphate isomerase/epimerase [Bacteroidia bacterium]|nr:sugar phosphate isomerase/epimerase [Bacteroidia bacterium]